MPALTAANVTVTLNLEDIDRSPDGRIGIRTFPTVAFGGSGGTYPALGIPMPAIGKFGFHFAIKRAYIEQPANGFIYHFDRTNHKVRIFQGAAQAALTIAANTQTGNVASAAHVHTLANLVMAAHTHNLLIVGNGVAPPVDMTGVNGVNLCANVGANATIAGADSASKGGVISTTPANGVSGDALSVTPANSTFTGDSHTHTVTGGTAIAAGALVELGTGAGDAPAATTLYMEMVGR